MVYQTLSAKKKIVKEFFRFSLAVIAIENDDEGQNRTFLSHLWAETLPAVISPLDSRVSTDPIST